MANILLIEDDTFVQSMLRQTLERRGHAVTTAGDGRKGLKLFDPQRFDLVITDLIMPDTEGIETIRMLRKQAADTPIIAISGGGRNKPDDYLFLARKLGAAYTFAKPVQRDQLLDAVAELTANR